MRQKTQLHKNLYTLKALLLAVAIFISTISTVGVTQAQAYTITLADFSHAGYGSTNPYNADYRYQCSWYVWGRVYEKLGIRISSFLTKIVNSSVTGGYSDTPSTNSVAVYMDDTGYVKHVAFVEYFDGSTVWFSEGNSWRGTGAERYYAGSLPYSKFVGSTELSNAHATQLRFVPLEAGGAVAAPAASSVTISSSHAGDVTTSNATVYATCNKPAGTYISTCGIYLGTSQGNMTKRNTETVSSAANSKSGGKSFDIWYNLADELKIGLDANTTYYCQFYCAIGSTEYKGDVFTFKTSGSTEVTQKIRVNVPANKTVQCYQTLGGTQNYRKFDAQSTGFYISCSKYAVYNGKNWFYVVDGSGNKMWFPDDSAYTVDYYPTSITVETDSIEIAEGETQSIKFHVSPANYTGTVSVTGPSDNSGIISLFTNRSVEGDHINITGKSDSSGYFEARALVMTNGEAIYSAPFKLKITDKTAPVIKADSVKFTDVTDESFKISFDVTENHAFGKNTIRVWNGAETIGTAVKGEMTSVANTDINYDRKFSYVVERAAHEKPFDASTYNLELTVADWAGNESVLTVSYDAKKVDLPENSIVYVLDGGVNNAKNPGSYTKATAAITLADPTKAGYIFAGWYSDSQMTKKITTIDTSVSKTYVVYAKWIQKSVNVVTEPKKLSAPSVSASAKKMTISWKKAADVSGYELQYSLKSNFKGAKTKQYSAGKAAATIKGLKSGKKYYVRIRSYKLSGTKKVYGKWSAKKTVKIK